MSLSKLYQTRYAGYKLVVGMCMLICINACGPLVEDEPVVSDRKPQTDAAMSLEEQERSRLAEIKAAAASRREDPDTGLKNVIKETPNYTVSEYLAQNPKANDPAAQDLSVGAYDVIDITVYEEPDLSRQNIQIAADGFISFPLIGRVSVEGKTPAEIEKLISDKLAQGQFLRTAHVLVTVREFRSKKFIALGSVKTPGTYPLQSRDRVLDVISRAGGVDFDQGGKQVMIIRTEHANIDKERKVVIRIDLNALMKGDSASNLLIANKDVIYIPKAENFHIMGQVKNPGSYPYSEKEITVVEAISRAGGFTAIAAPNRTRIIRIENGVEKVIHVKVDEITGTGKRGQDVIIQPGDVIIIPESYF